MLTQYLNREQFYISLTNNFKGNLPCSTLGLGEDCGVVCVWLLCAEGGGGGGGGGCHGIVWLGMLCMSGGGGGGRFGVVCVVLSVEVVDGRSVVNL